MASAAYNLWLPIARKAWDEIESAHAAVGGMSPGRRYATSQINQAYVVAISSHFQGFCRGLHNDAANAVAAAVRPISLQGIVRLRLSEGRKLDFGNANAGNLGSDFGRFSMNFWQEVMAIDPKNGSRKLQLDLLNGWRNAIAHQDFDPSRLGGIIRLHLGQVRRWRSVCERLAFSFDEALRRKLQTILGKSPW